MASDFASAESPAVSTGYLILETPNPLDLSVEDLTELAAQLEKRIGASGLGHVPVTARGYEPLGAANPFIDFLNIILPNAEFLKETAFTAVIAAVTAFMRKRFKRPHEGKRPRQVDIYAPDGHRVASVKLMSEDADPEWIEPSEE